MDNIKEMLDEVFKIRDRIVKEVPSHKGPTDLAFKMWKRFQHAESDRKRLELMYPKVEARNG